MTIYSDIQETIRMLDKEKLDIRLAAVLTEKTLAPLFCWGGESGGV